MLSPFKAEHYIIGLDTKWHIVVASKELPVVRILSLLSSQPLPRLYLTRHFTDPRRLYRVRV